MNYKKPFIISSFVIVIVVLIELIGLLVNQRFIIGDENYIWVFLLILLIFYGVNSKTINSAISDFIETKFDNRLAIIFGTIMFLETRNMKDLVMYIILQILSSRILPIIPCWLLMVQQL